MLASADAEHQLNPIDVSVVLATKDRMRSLQQTVSSVRAGIGDLRAEIIVICGESEDESRKWLLQQSDIVVVDDPPTTDRRVAWGAIMNVGFRAAKAEVICMLSDDCLLVPGVLERGVAMMGANPELGALAFPWRNWPEDSFYGVGFTFGDCVVVNHGMFRKSALEDVNFCDSRNFVFYHADGDLCLRIREAGWRVEYLLQPGVEHHSHVNIRLRRNNATAIPDDWSSYQRRWGYLGDPDVPWLRIGSRAANDLTEQYWGRRMNQLPWLAAVYAGRALRFLKSRWPRSLADK